MSNKFFVCSNGNTSANFPDTDSYSKMLILKQGWLSSMSQKQSSVTYRDYKWLCFYFDTLQQNLFVTDSKLYVVSNIHPVTGVPMTKSAMKRCKKILGMSNSLKIKGPHVPKYKLTKSGEFFIHKSIAKEKNEFIGTDDDAQALV